MKSVKVVGAGGYGGVGITELLLNHPEFEIGCLVAATETGMKMSDLYPHLKGFCDELIRTPDDPKAQEAYDAVFFSTPDGVGMQSAANELAKGAHVVDYSGDFRFTTPEKYSAYANFIGKIRFMPRRICCHRRCTAFPNFTRSVKRKSWPVIRAVSR